MNRSAYASSVRLLAILVAVGLPCAAVRAQGAAPASTQTPTASPTANPDADWLAKISKLYYSSARAGLAGFDCSVHPDWRTMLISTSKGELVADDDPRMTLLQSVRIGVHARMKGGSTVDWETESTPDKPLDENSTAMLSNVHRSVEQTLQGFLQFWSPFMEVSVIPESPEGVEITHTSTVHTIHAKQGGTELTEIFSTDLVLQQFNVNVGGMSIRFAPDYKPTPQGLLVHAFKARILPPGATPEQEQTMKAAVEYQTLNGLTVPAQLSIDVAGAGTFNFTFDGCNTNPK